jgi:hypothetical protein
MITNILSFCGSLGHQAKLSLKQWSNPATAALVTGALSDLTRSRADLIAENALLRQQLIVLQRHVKRPVLTRRDRALLVLMARKLPTWRTALMISARMTFFGQDRWDRGLLFVSAFLSGDEGRAHFLNRSRQG